MNIRAKLTKISFVFMPLFFCAATDASANLVTNGSFEESNGPFEQGTHGWTWSDFYFGSFWSPYTHSGFRSAIAVCNTHDCVSTAGEGAYLKQNIVTIPGSLYDLSFWVSEKPGPDSEISVFWNGRMVSDILNPANNLASDGTMVRYDFHGLLASENSTSFEIHGRADRTAIGFDDISVVETSAATIVEPGSLALLVLGALTAIGTIRRRRPMTG